ncbi:MAG: 4Fe-4S dicluster domain-containing protein, partial [Erysipelotrichia bacterium]|nr:4Fe-4S dicluster domain-containing protein [Erysipelotrichia bacterium]
DYFDFYLMHAQTADIYEHFQKCHAYEMAQEFKKEGRVKHVGLSFHDKAEVLDRILSEHPEIETVQIQLNYVDYDDPGIEGRKVLEVARKHGKPVIVMEPVKGGSLVRLPENAKKIYEQLGSASCASYAIRYAAGFDGIMMVLSGMSNYEQMEDNLSYMKDFKPLNDAEINAVDQVRAIFREMNLIPCTACHYCTADCPKKISIPEIFADLNAKKMYQDWNSNMYYEAHTHNAGKASDCIQCGQCEQVCPQHLQIRSLLKQAADVFDRKEN